MSSRTAFGLCLALALVGGLALYFLFHPGHDGVQRISPRDAQFTTSAPAEAEPLYTA